MNHFAKLLNELPRGVEFLMVEEFPPACVVAFAHNGREYSASVDKFDGLMEFWQIDPPPRCRVAVSDLTSSDDSEAPEEFSGASEGL